MKIRGIVIVVITGIIFLLSSGNIHRSQASMVDFQGDCLWEEWKDVSVPMIKARKVAPYFDRLFETRKFSGAVYVVEDGNVIFQNAYGYANLREKTPLTTHTPFQLASVSKIFTAAAIMVLYEDGKLDFDDKVSEHIQGWPYEDMTIRHLLNHRSGLARYMAVASWYWKTPKVPMTNQDVLSQYVRHKPVHFFTPDNGFNYCNTNYAVLAGLVERVSGMSFGEFMQKRIFDPLNMKNATIYSRGYTPEVENQALGYKAGWRGYYVAGEDYIDGVYGDKGMYASVEDLAKFDQALYDYTLLSKETLDQAYTPGSKRRYSNYGFGWRMLPAKYENLVYHFGWWRGYRTCFIRDLERKLSVIILTNRDHPGYYVDYWDVYEMVKDME
ncbi:MAG: beta-lactamase family protein [Bacteroidetes bacterium]|nr:beta-lactamase family protein [Bacteroidota bacterium]